LDWLHSIARCLALAELETIARLRSGRWSLPDLDRISAQLGLGLGWEMRPLEQPPRPFFLLESLVQAGLLRIRADKTQLAVLAEDWLIQPASAQLDYLREAWWRAPQPTWAWLRPSESASDDTLRWLLILDHTLARLRRMPTQAATPLEALIQPEVEALASPAGDPRLGPAAALAGRVRRVLSFLLLEVLPNLGALEVVQGTEGAALRLLPEARTWLARCTPTARRQALADVDMGIEPLFTGAELERIAQGQAASLAFWVDDLTLALMPQAPTAWTFELAHLADLVTPGPPTQYRLSPKGLASALERGYTADSARQLLTLCSGGSLPAPVAAWLEAQDRQLEVVACQPGYCLSVADAALLARIRSGRLALATETRA
jgi:hypothetical protein